MKTQTDNPNASDSQAIADRFGNDGMRWADDDGVHLIDVLRKDGAREDKYQSGTSFHYVYTMPDSSCILVTDNWWDLLDQAGNDSCGGGVIDWEDPDEFVGSRML